LGASFGEGLETLNTNDDRMNQVVFSQGILFSGVNSLLKVGGAEQQGIAWFGVQPSFEGSTLTGRIVRQGYVAVKGNDVLFPSLGINDSGNGVIAYTLAGKGFFPSAAYTDVIAGFALPLVHIAGARHWPTVHHYAGGQSVWFPPISDPSILLEGIVRHSVDYVVVVKHGQPYYLPDDDYCFDRLLAAHTENFRLVLQRMFAISWTSSR
jgi:hypothetical protein